MSELAVFARQGDISRSSNKTQKRPLSIITENDSDEPGSIDYTQYTECGDNYSKESASLCADTSELNKNSKGENAISEALEQQEPAGYFTSVSDIKVSSDASLVTMNHCSIGTQSSVHTAKSRRSTSFVRPSEASVALLGLRSGYQLENNGNRIPEETSSKTKSEKKTFPRLIISDIENSKHPQYNQPVLNIHHDVPASCDTTQTNTSTWTNSSGDGQNMTRVRETAERLNLLSALSPTSPSSSSSTLTSKFGHRLWTQTSTPRTLHQPKSPLGQNFQPFSLPTNGATPLVITLASSSDSGDINDTNNSTFLSDISDNNNSLNQSPVNRSIILSNSKLNSSKLNSSKLSSCFSRRMSNESNGSLSEGDLSDGDMGSDDGSQKYLSYFIRLKETTDRLRLSTRRPSIMLWRQQCMEYQDSSVGRSSQNGDSTDDRLTLDRKQRIDLALEWLRNQLQEMRSQDQTLARQLLAIRQDIHKLKLQRSTEEHQELIDDFHFELQELQEFSDVLDLPLPEYADNPLKHIGVTRLNISARRFSAC